MKSKLSQNLDNLLGDTDTTSEMTMEELDSLLDGDNGGFGGSLKDLDTSISEVQELYEEDDVEMPNLYQGEQYEIQEYDVGQEEQTDETGLMSKITNFTSGITQNPTVSKVATVSVIGAVGYGLWSIFGNKNSQTPNQAPMRASANQNTIGHSEPESYEDEFLDLDGGSENVDPMFTPLRFK